MVGGVPCATVTRTLKEAASVWLAESSCATVTRTLKEVAAVWLVESSCATVTRILKEAAADPTNNSNSIWYVLLSSTCV